MKTISPMTQLDVGTEVKVKDRHGIVVKVELVPAVPSGMIYVHTIRFTHKDTKVRNKDGSSEIVKTQIKNVIERVNYSFISPK